MGGHPNLTSRGERTSASKSVASTIGLGDPGATDPQRLGGKGVNLAAMTRAGLPVPHGFIVTTAAYRAFVEHHGLQQLIDQAIAQLDTDPNAVEPVSAQLRQAFSVAEMPAALRGDITDAYVKLDESAVAVRSSATAEDLPEASFAGQQDTVLNVIGSQSLCDAVKQCWSSLWSARAISYRRRNEIGNDTVSVAVVVQRMVHADVAGVMFTADPVSGRRDHAVLEAAGGLGEAVVSGRVTPQRWIIATAQRAVLSAPEGAAALSSEDLQGLLDLGVRTADLFDVPQDIEWAISDGRCWLLQSRPITSLFPLPPRSPAPGLRVYIPAMLIGQGVAEPFTTAGNALFGTLTSAWIRFLGTGRLQVSSTAPPWLPVVAGRLYIDATALLQRRRLAARLIDKLRLKEPTGSLVLQEWLRDNGSRLSPASRPLLSWGVLRWTPAMVLRVLMALVVPARSRRQVLAATDAELRCLERDAAALSSPLSQLDLVYRDLPAHTCQLVLDQLPAAYAEQLLRVAAQWLVARWGGDKNAFEPIRRWLPHDPTLTMGRALADLARTSARSDEELRASSPTMKEFLAAYGHRAPDREIDVGLPRITEQPSYVVDLVRGYLASGPEVASRFDTGAAESLRAADELVAGVRRTKGAMRAAFIRSLLDRHRELGGFRERPKFDMVRAIALARRVLFRVGAGLVDRGLLNEADDVFFLEPDDIRAGVRGEEHDLRALAAANRRGFRRELTRRAVPRILTTEGETVYGPSESASSKRTDVLVGTAISPGRAEGVVRVLDSPIGAVLQPGEVLVAASTDPGWTPLFLIAGALVMEVGGVVSHGAVVAREYGLPAVAAVPDATTRLRTGQRVIVDGNSGTVTLLG